jgi:hypothetical protein
LTADVAIMVIVERHLSQANPVLREATASLIGSSLP